MRNIFWLFSITLLLYFSYGFYWANSEIQIYKTRKPLAHHPLFYDYKGVSHVVTSYSRGSFTPLNILIEATKADLDFLFFTDLNLLDRPYNLSGYNGNVFSFTNQKISYLDSHILIYSENPDFYFDSLTTATSQLHQHFYEETNEDQSYLTVLAHPFKKNHMWTGEYPNGLDGIEVINMRHLWQELWNKDRMSFLLSIATYPFNPQLSLLRLIREPRRELELWDRLSQLSPKIGILGNETTAKIFKIFGLNFTFPSYVKSFRFASNHILITSELTGQAQSDRKKIFSAIRSGQFYFSFDSLGDPKGFATYMKSGKNTYPMGSKLKLNTDLSLFVDLPKDLMVPYKIEVFKNGQLFYQAQSENTDIKIDKIGVYRVVVKIQPRLPFPDDKRWYGWVYSNPFYVQ